MSSNTPNKQSLTGYAAQFVCDTQLKDLPADVMELGKKSMLDGIGLAISGSVAKSGELVRTYLQAQGVTSGTSTTIKIQWMRDGFGLGSKAARNRVTTNPDYSHRSLTIYD